LLERERVKSFKKLAASCKEEKREKREEKRQQEVSVTLSTRVRSLK